MKSAPPGSPVPWERVFIADVTKPEDRKKGITEKADGPMIMTAAGAIATSDPRRNRIQLAMHGFSSHEMGKDLESHHFSSPVMTQALNVKPPEQTTQQPREMTTRQLLHFSGASPMVAKVELHRRFKFPVGCLALALVGIPLGIATRKGGKSAAYLVALFLGFFCYWLSSMTLENVATQKTLSVAVASWLPNAVFIIAGILFLIRMELPGDRDVLSVFQGIAAVPLRWFKPSRRQEERVLRPAELADSAAAAVDRHVRPLEFPVLFRGDSGDFRVDVPDLQLLRSDRRHDQEQHPAAHHVHVSVLLTPWTLYSMTPICVLVAALANIGILSKQNEVTAFRPAG